MKTKTFGKITVAIGRRPDDHEFAVAEVFAKLGFDVEFLPENRSKGMRSADIQMDSVIWEIKTPIGKGKRTVEKQFHRASKQSKNIIIDSRFCGITDERFQIMMEKQVQVRRNLNKVLWVDKSGKVKKIK